MKDILTTEEWIRAIKALLFLNKNPEDIDIEYIKKIIEESTAGAYELPAVSSEDNGKVLGVENGQFGLVDGGGDAGYECTETIEQLFNETVTTAESEDGCFADLAYSEPITADELTVIFNGTQYICSKIENEGTVYYGGFDPNTLPDFTNYPFGIVSEEGVDFIVTESPMTATITASVVSTTVETTECFEKAVNTACGGVLVVNANEDSFTNGLVLDKTWAEIQEAVVSHGVVVHMDLVGGGYIYSPVMVGMDSNRLYSVSMLDGTNVRFTTTSVYGYPKYDQTPIT